MAKTLDLKLKKKWFELILSGEKKQEYRELKLYWINRLTWHEFHWMRPDEVLQDYENGIPILMDKYFDTIRFTNGYGADKPTFEIECKGISIGEGKPEWGFEKTCFIIKLGNILSSNNITK